MKTRLLQLALVVGFAATAAAGSNPLDAEPVSLKVSSVMVTEPGLTPASHAFITARGDYYDILVMSGFRVDNDASLPQVRFTKLDNTCWLTFRIIAPPGGSGGVDVNTCTNHLAVEYPNCRITESFSLTAAGQGGPAFDFIAPFSGLNSRHRIVYIPTPKGIWEFHLQSSDRYFGPSTTDFRDFLNNFRMCPNGRTDLTPPPRDPGAAVGN